MVLLSALEQNSGNASAKEKTHSEMKSY